MNTKSTPRKSKGRSEKLLLIAIMAIGILGLTFTYGTKNTDTSSVSASTTDTISSNGKIQSDRMILHLNQLDKESSKSTETTRF